MNRQPPQIRFVSQGRFSVAATLIYLLLRLVLSVEVPTHPCFGAPQTVTGSARNYIAPPSGSAVISGTVRDQSGRALVGARVTLTDERTSVQRVVLTTENGVYIFTPVGTGSYLLAAELRGFQNAVCPHLTVTGPEHLNVELSLAPKGSGPGEKTGDARAISSPKGSASEPTFGQFDYDDKPNYKPGDIASSSESGGYSSGANADSYDLILAYVEGEPSGGPKGEEGAEKGTNRGGGVESRAPKQVQHSEIDEATLQAWNENQLFSRGSDLLLHRDFTSANDLFQRGTERFPASAKLQMGLGVALYARGLYDQAVDALLHATDMLPSDPRPYLLLARAYTVSHSRNDEVVKRFAHLVDLDPKSAPARRYYALSLWRRAGEKPDASASQVERLLEEAVNLDPQFADAHLDLGTLFAEQAKYSEAIREYRLAIAINPDLAAAHYRLAQAYTRTGDRAAAETELGLYEQLRDARGKK